MAEKGALGIKDGKRFARIHKESQWGDVSEIWVDRETSVSYFLQTYGNTGCGLTPLLDREGKPVITEIFDEE